MLADIDGCVDCDALLLPSLLVAAGLGEDETLADAIFVEPVSVDADADAEEETDTPAGTFDELADGDAPADTTADREGEALAEGAVKLEGVGDTEPAVGVLAVVDGDADVTAPAVLGLGDGLGELASVINSLASRYRKRTPPFCL